MSKSSVEALKARIGTRLPALSDGLSLLNFIREVEWLLDRKACWDEEQAQKLRAEALTWIERLKHLDPHEV